MTQRDILFSWIGRSNIVQLTILPKAIFRFSAIPIKLPIAFFTELGKNVTVCMETQKTPNNQSSLEKEKWNWKTQAPWLQIVLQSYNKQCAAGTKGFPGDSVVKNLLTMQKTWAQSLGQEDPLEKERATHTSILTWEISWTGEPAGIHGMAKESDATEHTERIWNWLTLLCSRA